GIARRADHPAPRGKSDAAAPEQCPAVLCRNDSFRNSIEKSNTKDMLEFGDRLGYRRLVRLRWVAALAMLPHSSNAKSRRRSRSFSRWLTRSCTCMRRPMKVPHRSITVFRFHVIPPLAKVRPISPGNLVQPRTLGGSHELVIAPS